MYASQALTNPSLEDAPLEYNFPCANPSRLIDRLRDMKLLRNDADLCRTLGVTPPVISKIRSGKVNVSAAMPLRIHEVFGLPIPDLRQMLAQE